LDVQDSDVVVVGRPTAAYLEQGLVELDLLDLVTFGESRNHHETSTPSPSVAGSSS
jgi:hypothetical protein